jgi:molybdopterin/thiamine biosynthesis adenylyltransferase
MSRYSRQELFLPVGPEGQARVRESRVLLVGCGALGTHLAEFCVRAGVGELTLIDRDFVEFSNLQRQSLFTEQHAADITPKAVAAAEVLRAVNSDVAINPVVGDFGFRNAEKLAAGSTLILDATDNFEARYLVNDVAVKLGIPWVYAGCVGARAVAMPVLPGKSACLRCVLEDAPATGGETCDTAGVIMPAVLQAVAWATGAALKILSGNRDAVLRKLLQVDVWTGERSAITAEAPRADCPACGERQFPWLDGERGSKQAVLCGRNSVQLTPDGAFDYLAARAQISKAAGVSNENDHLLRASCDGLEVTLYRDGRALVHGTSDASRARALYTKLVGG